MSVSLEEYIAFCRELKEIAQCPIAFMSLDKIAGSRVEGRLPTEKQTEEACETSWKYYRQLRAAGIEAIPTFHQFEDPKWLFQFLNDGIDYIALSPRKSGVSTADKVEWLGHVFKEVGIDTKVHGLGVAGSEAMESFPFYSIDSSSWLQGSNGTFRYFDGRRVDRYLGMTGRKIRFRLNGMTARMLWPKPARSIGHRVRGETTTL